MFQQPSVQRTSPGQNARLVVDVHFGRFLILDPAIQSFRAKLKRHMPHFNFESIMSAGDRWVLSVRSGTEITGMAVFSGAREHPIMDFYYAGDPATTSVLMSALNQWRKR